MKHKMERFCRKHDSHEFPSVSEVFPKGLLSEFPKGLPQFPAYGQRFPLTNLRQEGFLESQRSSIFHVSNKINQGTD